MSVTSVIVVYAVLWFLILWMTLPFGIRSQEEAGHVEPGTPAGAPAEPMVGKKMIWATIGAAVGTAAIYGVIVGEIITHDHIARFAPFDPEW